MVNKKTHKRRLNRKKKIMKGGAYNPEELDTLRNNNFTDNQIETLENMDIPINEVMRKINDKINEGENSDDITDIVMAEIMDENIFQNQNNNVMNIEPIQNNEEDEEDIHYLYDNDDDDDLNSSRNSSIHLSDLNDSRMSGYTTNPDESFRSDQSFGGKKIRKRLSKKIKKNKKGKKSRKNRKSKKQRGGTCYGSGVGANNYDPNFSIHNTRELKLFPYNSS